MVLDFHGAAGWVQAVDPGKPLAVLVRLALPDILQAGRVAGRSRSEGSAQSLAVGQ